MFGGGYTQTSSEVFLTIPGGGAGIVPFTNPTALVNMALVANTFVPALPGIYHYTVVVPTATVGLAGGTLQPFVDDAPIAPPGSVVFLGTTIVLDGYVELAAGQGLSFRNQSGVVITVALSATISGTVERVQAL